MGDTGSLCYLHTVPFMPRPRLMTISSRSIQSEIDNYLADLERFLGRSASLGKTNVSIIPCVA
jgi:hypothetical protein